MHGASALRSPETRHAALQIPAVLAALAVLHGIWQWARSRKRVFLLDFACYKPPDDLKVSYEGFITGLANAKVSTQLLPSSGSSQPYTAHLMFLFISACLQKPLP